MKVNKSITKNNRSNLKKVIMNGKLILIAMCLILASYGIAGADYLLIDQEYMANVNNWHNLSYFKFDQEFTPSLSSINMVRLALHTNEEGAALRINIRQDSIYGPIIGTSEEHLPRGFNDMALFMFASPMQLTQGSSYIIDLELLSGSAFVASAFEAGGYPQGLMYIDGYNTPTDNSDLIFQTGNMRSNVIKIISGAKTLCRGINSNDKLIIAILSNDVLDATMVDPESVTFAEAGVKRGGKNGRLQCSQKDSNYDGLPDLTCSIDVKQLVIEQDALSIDVTAETYDGMRIMGDEVLCGGQN